jgi:GNAT superfamily N-acetyltransferase
MMETTYRHAEEEGRSSLQIQGYFPGAIGMIAGLHGAYYHRHWGFDKSFEIQVARELSDFIESFDTTRDGIWIAIEGQRFVGSIAIDGTRWQAEGARLRWFIVDPSFHRMGMGGILLRRAVDFCRERRNRRIFLWTFEGLDRARSLYERAGFRLTEEHISQQWGGRIKEQRFDLLLE